MILAQRGPPARPGWARPDPRERLAQQALEPLAPLAPRDRATPVLLDRLDSLVRPDWAIPDPPVYREPPDLLVKRALLAREAPDPQVPPVQRGLRANPAQLDLPVQPD